MSENTVKWNASLFEEDELGLVKSRFLGSFNSLEDAKASGEDILERSEVEWSSSDFDEATISSEIIEVGEFPVWIEISKE